MTTTHAPAHTVTPITTDEFVGVTFTHPSGHGSYTIGVHVPDATVQSALGQAQVLHTRYPLDAQADLVDQLDVFTTVDVFPAQADGIEPGNVPWDIADALVPRDSEQVFTAAEVRDLLAQASHRTLGATVVADSDYDVAVAVGSVRDAARALETAADGDSNDVEIEAGQNLRDAALSLVDAIENVPVLRSTVRARDLNVLARALTRHGDQHAEVWDAAKSLLAHAEKPTPARKVA